MMNQLIANLKSHIILSAVSPNSLKAIDVLLFSHFPGFEELEVQMLTPKRQTAVELTPKKFQLSL